MTLLPGTDNLLINGTLVNDVDATSNSDFELRYAGFLDIPSMRVSMGWWLLRLSAKISALLRLSVKFFQLRLTKKLKIYFFCFKELNINKPVFFLTLKQN